MKYADIKPYFESYDAREENKLTLKPGIEFRICGDTCEEIIVSETHITYILDNDDEDWVLPVDAVFDSTASLIAI